jgi:hypothetical protein
MTLALLCLGLGMVLVLAGVKGYSVRSLLLGNFATPAANQSVATA